MLWKPILLAVAALLPVSVNSDAIDMWMSLPRNPKLFTSFQTSLEVPEGHDPNYTYWCAAAWFNGYFGIQRTNGDDHAVIFTLWNQGNKSARILEAAPNAKIHMCEEHCAEGSAAQVMLHGATWQPGVKYQFKVDVERDGENEIYTAQMYKDNQWNLIAKAMGPNYANLGLGYLYQFLETYESDYEYQRVGVYSEQFYQVEGNTTWIPVLSVTPTKNPNRNHLYYAYSAALTEEKNGIVLSLDGDGPGNADGTTYMKSLYYNTKNIHFPEQTPKKMPSSTTTSKPAKKTQTKQDTLRKFQITDATCYCNDVSTLSSPVYMDDFLVAFQNQGYWWDTAAQQSNSEREFMYNGTSATGRDYTAVTKINAQKPYDGVRSISAMLYECFMESETVPGYNNELIPSECSVHTNNNEVIAGTQFF